jgi:thiamine biosynthesis lipoprotein
MQRECNVKRITCFLVSFALFCLLCTVPACSSKKDHIYRKSRMLMNTIVTITVVASSERTAENAIEDAFLTIADIEKRTDFYAPESEITSINKSAGVSDGKVSPDILSLIGKALSVSEKTEGAFDITTGPVTLLYDFHTKQKPEDDALTKTLPLVNSRNVVINKKDSTVYLRKPGMMIDPGGISKGYAADRATDVLKQQGISSGIVAIAGDIRAFGLKPDGRPWKIGIRNSRATGPEDDIMATLELTDAAVSTSGDYERFFINDGIRYHHILSPMTGRPAGMCRSVTVIAPEGFLADSFSTGIFILGPENGLRTLETSGYGGIIVDNQGKMHITPDLRGKIEFQRNP